MTVGMRFLVSQKEFPEHMQLSNQRGASLVILCLHPTDEKSFTIREVILEISIPLDEYLEQDPSTMIFMCFFSPPASIPLQISLIEMERIKETATNILFGSEDASVDTGTHRILLVKVLNRSPFLVDESNSHRTNVHLVGRIYKVVPFVTDYLCVAECTSTTSTSIACLQDIFGQNSSIISSYPESHEKVCVSSVNKSELSLFSLTSADEWHVFERLCKAHDQAIKADSYSIGDQGGPIYNTLRQYMGVSQSTHIFMRDSPMEPPLDRRMLYAYDRLQPDKPVYVRGATQYLYNRIELHSFDESSRMEVLGWALSSLVPHFVALSALC